MISKKLYLLPVYHDESVYKLGIRYKVISASGDTVYFYTIQQAMDYCDGMGICEMQTTLSLY